MERSCVGILLVLIAALASIHIVHAQDQEGIILSYLFYIHLCYLFSTSFFFLDKYPGKRFGYQKFTGSNG